MFVCKRGQDIFVSARGTNVRNRRQLLANFRASKIHEEDVGRIHTGLREQIDKVWYEHGGVFSYIWDISEEGDRIYTTGHSQGGGIAQVACGRLLRAQEADWQATKYRVAGCTTFGSMLAYDRRGAAYVSSRLRRDHRDGFYGRLHWRNNNDIVTTVPPGFWGFQHTGPTVYIKPGKQGGRPSIRVNTSFCWMLWQRLVSLSHLTFFDGLKDHPLAAYQRELNKL